MYVSKDTYRHIPLLPSSYKDDKEKDKNKKEINTLIINTDSYITKKGNTVFIVTLNH